MHFLTESSVCYDVICLSETWLTEGELFEISGYNFLSCPRTPSDRQSRGGGVAIFISNRFDYSVRNDMNFVIPNMSESLFLEIKGFGVLGCVYRSPCCPLSTFLTEFEDTLVLLNSIKNSVLIMGDFNVDVLRLTNYEYTYLLDSFGLFNMISEPTRVTENSRSLIDHVIARKGTSAKCGVIDVPISDHCLIYCICNAVGITRKAAKSQSCPSSRINFLKLRSLIQSYDWSELWDDDVNREYEKFCVVLRSLITASTFFVHYRQYKQPVCPWMNSELLHVLRQKMFWYRKHKGHPSNACFAVNFRYFRNLATKLNRVSKMMYYSDVLLRCKGDSRKIWAVINTVVKSENNTNILPKIKSNPEALCNEFNHYFTSVGRQLASTFGESSSDPISFIKTSVPNSFFMSPITIAEIIATIRSLKSRVATGPDGISVIVLKTCADVLAVPLQYIFNHACSAAVYPDGLKTARIVPVYKSGDKDQIENYRPISVLSVINTIFEN